LVSVMPGSSFPLYEWSGDEQQAKVY
jgi:hypothetical protein